MKAVAGTLFFAGADTSVAALGTFILAMLANPDAQKKAQEEIDLVTGRDYLPTFEHEEELPYVAALVKEVLRWKPVAPFGIYVHSITPSHPSDTPQRCPGFWRATMNIVDIGFPRGHS